MQKKAHYRKQADSAEHCQKRAADPNIQSSYDYVQRQAGHAARDPNSLRSAPSVYLAPTRSGYTTDSSTPNSYLEHQEKVAHARDWANRQEAYQEGQLDPHAPASRPSSQAGPSSFGTGSGYGYHGQPGRGPTGDHAAAPPPAPPPAAHRPARFREVISDDGSRGGSHAGHGRSSRRQASHRSQPGADPPQGSGGAGYELQEMMPGQQGAVSLVQGDQYRSEPMMASSAGPQDQHHHGHRRHKKKRHHQKQGSSSGRMCC